VCQTSRLAGAAAELAASRKSAKYADLLQSHLFQPMAVEISGFMDSCTAIFLLTWAAKYIASTAMFSFSRCAPGPQRSDHLLRSPLLSITNNTLSDSQWRQATLPVKFGGLGIRRVSSLALSAFLPQRRVLLCYRTRLVVHSRCQTVWQSR